MRVLKDYERFFLNVFKGIREHDIDVMEIALTFSQIPSFVFERVRGGFLKSLKDILKDSDLEQHTLHLGVCSLFLLVFSLWDKGGKLPISRKFDILDEAYTYFLNDFKAVGPFTYEDAMKVVTEDCDLYSDKMSSYAWYIFNSLRAGENFTNVGRLVSRMVELTLKRGEKSDDSDSIKTSELYFIRAMQDNYYNEVDKNHDVLIEAKAEAVRRASVCGLEELASVLGVMYSADRDEIIVNNKNKEFLHFLLYLVEMHALAASGWENSANELKRELDGVRRGIQSAVGVVTDLNMEYQEEVIRLRMELESLSRKAGQGEKRLVVVEDRSTSKQLSVMEQKYEGAVKENMMLRESLGMYEQAVSGVFSGREGGVDEDKFPQKVFYFGQPNAEMVRVMRESYGVEVEVFSAVKLPSRKPRGVVFFNPWVASHKVWDYIRDLNPLVVSGTNARLLIEQMVAYMKRA